MSFRKVKCYAIAFLTLLIVAGCSSGSDKKGAGDRVKIEYWHVNADTQGGRTVDELVEDYNASQDKYEVIAKYNPDMYKGLMQNLQAATASNQMPDIVQVGWGMKDYFSENFEYIDPMDLMSEVAPDDEDFFKETFLENIMELAEKDDEYVGLPYSLSDPVVYINKDLFEEADLPAEGPATWADIQSFSKQVKDNTGKYGLYFQEPADNWALQALLESNGADFLKDGKAAFASEEGIEAAQLYQDMVVEDGSALHATWDQGIQSFIDGNVGMLYATIAQLENVESNANFEILTVKSPKWGDKEPRLPSGGAMLSVTSPDKERKEASWDFLKYLYEVDNMAKWSAGTGYVPPRKDMLESEEGKKFLADAPLMEPALEQIDKLVSWASFPGKSGLEAEQKLLDMRDRILDGEDVEKVMKDTQDEINELLD